jgi:hypothetical protein
MFTGASESRNPLQTSIRVSRIGRKRRIYRELMSTRMVKSELGLKFVPTLATRNFQRKVAIICWRKSFILYQCCPTFLHTRVQLTDAYGGAGATTLLLLLPFRNTTPSTTTNNNNNKNNSNKIIRNLILTKSFVNIIIFTYNHT